MSGKLMSSTTRVRDSRAHVGQPLGAALGHLDLVTGQREGAAEHVAQRAVIVNDQEPHRAIVACWSRPREPFLRCAYSLTQHRAEDPVDEAGRLRPAEALGRLHRLVDGTLRGDRLFTRQL